MMFLWIRTKCQAWIQNGARFQRIQVALEHELRLDHLLVLSGYWTGILDSDKNIIGSGGGDWFGFRLCLLSTVLWNLITDFKNLWTLPGRNQNQSPPLRLQIHKQHSLSYCYPLCGQLRHELTSVTLQKDLLSQLVETDNVDFNF